MVKKREFYDQPYSMEAMYLTREMLEDLSRMESAEDFRTAVEIYFASVFSNVSPSVTIQMNGITPSPTVMNFLSCWYNLNRPANDSYVKKCIANKKYYVKADGYRYKQYGDECFGLNLQGIIDTEREPVIIPVEHTQRYLNEVAENKISNELTEEDIQEQARLELERKMAKRREHNEKYQKKCNEHVDIEVIKQKLGDKLEEKGIDLENYKN